MQAGKKTVLGITLASALALLCPNSAFAAAKGSMMPLNSGTGPVSLMPANSNNMQVLQAPLGSVPNAPRSNFTFIPAGVAAPMDLPASQLPALPVAAPVHNYNDPQRHGYGQQFDESQQTATAQTLLPPIAVDAPAYNPAMPPTAASSMVPAYVPANSRIGARALPLNTLTDGQSFSGLIAQPQQAGFYTLVARTQAEFADLWRNHIGQEPPTAQLDAGQAAVFATTGPRAYSGYNVRLQLLNFGSQNLQVLATEISPSSTVALGRLDCSPWQILIVRTNGARVEVLHRKELAGSTVY